MARFLKIFTIIYIFILLLTFCCFISAPVKEESFLRIISGSIVIFLFPGLVFGELLEYKSDHILETISISFALTLTIEILILPFLFLFASGIKLWVICVLIICLVGIIYLNVRKGKELQFISPLFNFFHEPLNMKISTGLILFILTIISLVIYKWGAKLFGDNAAGETLLHMFYIRYYFSMPFVLNDLGIHQGSPPPNIIQLWEFLLAGWARLINTDPIFIFWRARFVIPFLGLSGMYLLVKNVCCLWGVGSGEQGAGSREWGTGNGGRIKAEILFWAVLIMCSGWFIILSPSNFDWVKSDPFRGLFMFMGTVHHADAAMDLLIALSAGIVFMVFNNFSWRNIFLLAGILSVCFMWHVREFFQIALYGGILSISLLIFPAENKKEILKKTGIILGVFLFIAVLFYLFMSFSTGSHSQAYNEVDIKKTALKYAFLPENIMGIRSLFNFPYNLFLAYYFAPDKILSQEDIHSIFKGNSEGNPQFFLWLILSAVSIPFLVKLGDRGDRRFSLFYILLWFSSLLWNFSMLMIVVFTYSEFHMGTPRVIYIFSYIVIAAGLYNVLRWFFIPGEIKKKSKKEKSKENKQNIFIPLIILHCAGWIIKLWWSLGISGIYFFSFLLSIAFIICFCFLLIPYFYNLLQKENKENLHSICVYILGIFLFFLPLLGSEYYSFCGKILKNNPDIEWFGDKNILGFSQKLMSYLETVPSKQTFLVHPISGPPMPVYYPQYLAVVPSKMEANVINDQVFYDEFQRGCNPLFPVSISADTVINHEIVREWLAKNKVNYILIQRDYYDLLLKYFSSHTENYEIMFNNTDFGEMVVKIRNL